MAARHSSFTLVELLVVIAIIAVLASMLMPTLSKAKAVAKRNGCITNLKQLAVATALYADDHGDHFPMAWDYDSRPELWCAKLGVYAPADVVQVRNNNSSCSTVSSVFACPARPDPDPLASAPDAYIGYAMNDCKYGSLDFRRDYRSFRVVTRPAEKLVAMERWSYNYYIQKFTSSSGSSIYVYYGHPGLTGNYQFADGHVEALGRSVYGGGRHNAASKQYFCWEL